MFSESVFLLTTAQSDSDLAQMPVVTDDVVSEIVQGLGLEDWFSADRVAEYEAW
jgi:hypothetical protein